MTRAVGFSSLSTRPPINAFCLLARRGAHHVAMKIAQPRNALISPDRLTIGRAACVQWSGRRLERATGDPLPALVLETAIAIADARERKEP